jgi:glyoxylase-like metal-dependent hydrolase (beta-lactamase superfamily II)
VIAREVLRLVCDQDEGGVHDHRDLRLPSDDVDGVDRILPGHVRFIEGRRVAVMKTYQAGPDIEVIVSDFPIPGYGLLAINAFVLRGSEPLLVDTGAVVESEEFMSALRSVIDPAELRWIWLSHTDFDHIGSLGRLLAENPRIRVITTFLGVGIMTLSAPLPMERLNFVNPGDRIKVGERTLVGLRPPTFDNPASTGFFDESSGTLFSVDSFGALLQTIPQSADEIQEQDLERGQLFWTSVDAPWLHVADGETFGRSLRAVADLQPELILSSHLPAAPGSMMEQFVTTIARVPAGAPFIGPDQAALEAMLRQMRAA